MMDDLLTIQTGTHHVHAVLLNIPQWNSCWGEFWRHALDKAVSLERTTGFMPENMHTHTHTHHSNSSTLFFACMYRILPAGELGTSGQHNSFINFSHCQKKTHKLHSKRAFINSLYCQHFLCRNEAEWSLSLAFAVSQRLTSQTEESVSKIVGR